jgi:hypothetical protein
VIPDSLIRGTLWGLKGVISVIPFEIVLQIILVGISALAGAAALLWLQSKLQRIKFIRALEDEIMVNLHTIQDVGNSVHGVEGDVNLRNLYFSTEVYKTIRVNDPILSSRFMNWMDPLYHSYQNFQRLNNRESPQIESMSEKEALETLLKLENQLVEAGYDLRQEQRSNKWYRAYNRLSWDDNLSIELKRHFEIVPNGETWRESVDIEMTEPWESE